MKTWMKLTDEQRGCVFDLLRDAGTGEAIADAHEAARVVLLAAREERATAERDEARAACELALRAAAASLACSTCQGRHGSALVEEALRLVTWAAPVETVEPLQVAAQARWSDLQRERDLARGALVADSHNQRAQLAEYGLEAEFDAHIGGDLASGLGEALVVARRARDEAQAREAKLREAPPTADGMGRNHDCGDRDCGWICAACRVVHFPCPVLPVDPTQARVVALPKCSTCSAPMHRLCHLYRVEVKRERDEALAREVTLRAALVLVDGWLGSLPLRRIASIARIHSAGITDEEFATLGKPALDALAAALALPTDRTALDALLAEARREGAQACVEAAHMTAQSHAEHGVALLADAAQAHGDNDGAFAVLAAVERAAAEIGAAKEKP